MLWCDVCDFGLLITCADVIRHLQRCVHTHNQCSFRFLALVYSILFLAFLTQSKLSFQFNERFKQQRFRLWRWTKYLIIIRMPSIWYRLNSHMHDTFLFIFFPFHVLLYYSFCLSLKFVSMQSQVNCFATNIKCKNEKCNVFH